MKRVTIGILSAALVAAAIPATAQQPPAPKPGPEHKKLGYFVGKWHSEGEMKPGPMGEGGKMSGDDECRWMGEGFFVTCSMNGTSPMGKVSGMGVMGYDSAKKSYTWNGFNSLGENEAATGTLSGNTWTYHNDSVMGGKNVKGRYTMVELSPESYTYKFDMSEDGQTWATVMEGKVTKVAAKESRD